MSTPQACIKYHSERLEMGFIRHHSLRHFEVPAAFRTNPVWQFFIIIIISQLTDAAEKSALEAWGMKATNSQDSRISLVKKSIKNCWKYETTVPCYISIEKPPATVYL
jgi:hypothetical protein